MKIRMSEAKTRIANRAGDDVVKSRSTCPVAVAARRHAPSRDRVSVRDVANGRILAMQPPPSRRTSIMVLGPSRG